MNPDEKSLKFLTKLRSVLEDDALTRKEFVDAFAQVVKIIKELKSANATELRTMNDFLTRMSEKMKSDVSSEMSSAEKKTMSYCEAEMKKIMKEHGAKMKEMDEKIMMVQDGIDGKDADEKRIVDDVLAKVPTPPFLTSIEIRDRLEILKDEERLDKSSIKGLEDEINALRKEIATKSSGGVRRVFQPYVDDFTASTNGSLKVFVLSRAPLRTNTVQVFGTDFPTILRPTTDFTVSGKTLTLTSAVPAPNTGATLLIHYYA